MENFYFSGFQVQSYYETGVFVRKPVKNSTDISWSGLPAVDFVLY
jgi:hypothetical protein